MTTVVPTRLIGPVASLHADTVADLRVLHDRLATAGVETWLVRHTEGLAVAVPGFSMRAAQSALRFDGFDWVQTAPGVVSGGRGEDTSRWIDLESWDIGAHSVSCPRPNALTREQFDSADLQPTTVELFDRRWRTLVGMFDAHADDVGHDIDVVFSWVDGTDPAFLSRRAGRMDRARLGVGDDADARTMVIFG